MAQLSTFHSGMGAVLAPIWSGATYVGKIGSAITPGRTGNSGRYYGDHDGAKINNAITSLSGQGSGAPQIDLPGNCGTKQQIDASNAFLNNPSLVGLGMSSTGFYALAPISGDVYNRACPGSAGPHALMRRNAVLRGGAWVALASPHR